ncbi:MAG: hypothetical protein IIZ19_08000 [Clostridia bacterium]|nr:hypothetical protein [Clostridia bacterium]
MRKSNSDYLALVKTFSKNSHTVRNMFRAFVIVGAVCDACLLLIDKTNLTPTYKTYGMRRFGRDTLGRGAAVPLLGFACSLARGVGTIVIFGVLASRVFRQKK